MSRHSSEEATVLVFGLVPGDANAATKVLLDGRVAVNRALHGDRVAVRLLPAKKKNKRRRGEAGEEEGAAPMETEGDASAEGATEPAAPAVGVRHGVVVGIVERKWRPLCGSIDERDVQVGRSRGEQDVGRVGPVRCRRRAPRGGGRGLLPHQLHPPLTREPVPRVV